VNPIEALQHLEQAGVPTAQAMAIANVIEQRRDQLVTSAELKTELGALSAEFKTEIGALEIRLSDKIAHVKDELEGQLRGLWRLIWPVLGIGAVTWVLQIFSTELRHFFHLP
jgi:hypothetical protein